MREEHVREKRAGLDMLRGVGILGIVLFHMFPAVFRGGFLGVPLFFVLSGYLMVVTCECSWERGKFRIRDYYKRRAVKIIPPLFAMVAVVCAYLTLTHNSRLNGLRWEIVSIFLGYENWWQIRQQGSYFSHFSDASPFTHLWFLAVEIQCYLIWPFLFLLYKKGCEVAGGRKMCFLFLVLALLSAGKMCWLYSPGGDPSRVYYGTDTMAFSLLIGMFSGAVQKEFSGCGPGGRPAAGKTAFCRAKSGEAKLRKQWYRFGGRFSVALFALVLFLLFLTVDGQTPFLYQGGMFLLSLFFAIMIHWVEKQRPSTGSHPVLSLLGEKSYGIYLWHYPIILLAFV